MKRCVVVFALVLSLLPAAAFAQAIVGVLGIDSEVAAVVGRSGAGKVNAAIVATLLIGHFKPSAIVFSGTAGAIDPALFPGDVVIGATVAQHDVGFQGADNIRRRGTRNPVTGAIEPLLVPAPETLLAAARS